MAIAGAGLGGISPEFFHTNKQPNVQQNQKEAGKFSDVLERMAGKTYTEEEFLAKSGQNGKKAPYSYMAEDGIIEYKGAVFVCDFEHNTLCLGDTSDPKNCINIPLSGGGCLKVNRDNLEDLAGAIGMFSPEDINLILRAISQDAKIQQTEKEIDDITSSIGTDSAVKTEEK